ncbi:MAG: DNA/RNA non-specific endonuclease [Bacteroidales bacterium]|nr:DNA/RNA non-specific endonuclease [Bacteroidales bacterium]
MKRIIYILAVISIVLISNSGQAQTYRDTIKTYEEILQRYESKTDSVRSLMGNMKLKYIQSTIESVGLPIGAIQEEITSHPGLRISYNENHEIANWVASMILPDIKTGNFGRTNDFRVDTSISTGSTEEADFFLKTRIEADKYEYDGYGFDRGHLAPSADYRWSQTAMSATYFYSNMTPQHPDFNRGKWASVEAFLRAYIMETETELIIYTGPILYDNMPQVKRSINEMSLPDEHYKIAIDMENERVITFLMPNQRIDNPIEDYVVTIDSIEKKTGLDFLTQIPENKETELESQNNPEPWFSGKQKGDRMPLTKSELPPKAYNTRDARAFMGAKRKATICGTVVSTHKSQKGNTFINLDKSFPNQVFSITIWASDHVNFPFKPAEFLMDKKICVTGKVTEYNGTPSLYLSNENNIEILD